jgi:hypothetical protein
VKIRALALFLAFALPITHAACAQHQTFSVNPDACHVTFSLAGTGHQVQGTFHVQRGSIEFEQW